jgi:hypothetical protein
MSYAPIFHLAGSVDPYLVVPDESLVMTRYLFVVPQDEV